MELSADSWAPARKALRAADPRMASLVGADPTLDPDTVLDRWPTDLWGVLVFNVVGQQLSVAATRAIVGRLGALQDGRLPTPGSTQPSETSRMFFRSSRMFASAVISPSRPVKTASRPRR